MTRVIFKKWIIPVIAIFICALVCVAMFCLFGDQYKTAAEVAELFRTNDSYFQECQTMLEAQDSISYISFLETDVKLKKSDYVYEINGIYFFCKDELDEQKLSEIAEALGRLDEHVPLNNITIRTQPMSIEFNLKARNILNAVLIVYASNGEPITAYMHDTAQIEPNWFAYITGD